MGSTAERERRNGFGKCWKMILDSGKVTGEGRRIGGHIFTRSVLIPKLYSYTDQCHLQRQVPNIFNKIANPIVTQTKRTHNVQLVFILEL